MKNSKMSDGHVWDREWTTLTTVSGWIGERPNAIMAYMPSQIGYVFLKGIEKVEKK